MVKALLSNIYSWYTPIRDAFMEDVHKLSSEQLLQLAKMEASVYRRRKQELNGAAAVGALLLATAFVYLYQPDLQFPSLIYSLALAGIGGTVYSRLRDHVAETHRRFLWILEQEMEDGRFLGVALTLLSESAQ